MSLDKVTDIEQLRKINKALLNRVESSMDQQGNAFSLFQTAINLEGQVKRRTDELTVALRRLEKSNAELAVAKEASDRANHSKTRFLAAASHDVLQPLNAALLSIAVLADMQESELGVEMAGQIERSLETMSELLRVLIDISKLDAGIATPHFESFQLLPVLEGIQSDFSPIATERNLRFRLRCASNLMVRSDRTMFRRIMQNLVSNALRYTAKGGVLIAARSRQGLIQIEVIDTGSGIPAEQGENIFEEFNRGALPKGHEREANSGLGLGLSIVRRMVDALSHKLSFVSKVDRGTRFRLSVDKALEVSENHSSIIPDFLARKSSNTAGKRILLIENDPAGIKAMMDLLKSWKLDPKVSRNINETRTLLGNDNWKPDLVIADQHLDHGDLGTTAIEVARGLVGVDIPAVVITADPTKALDKKVIQMSLELMLKPIKPAQLRALINHLMVSLDNR